MRESELRLQTMPESELAMSMPAKENATELELTMTKSAIAYEYALEALDQEGEFGYNSEKLRLEIEAVKQTYFNARTRLLGIDRQRLNAFEIELKWRRESLFTKNTYLH